MFAYVQYIFDGKTAVVKHCAISDFKPKNVADFQPTKCYSVYWPGDDSTDGDFYEARILHLTESMEEMEAYMEKRPRKVVVDLPKGRKRNKEKVEQSQKKLRTDARKRSELELADEVLQDDESDFVTRSAYTALQLELQAVQSELDSLQEQLKESTHVVSSAQQVPQDQSSALLRGTCICAEKHYKELKEEMQQLRAMNMELQKTLSYKLFQSESRVVYATSFDVSVRAQPDPVTPLSIGGKFYVLLSLCYFDILGSTTRVVPAPRVHCQTGRARLPLQRTTVPEELAQRESATVVQKDAAAADSPECGTAQNYDAAASNFDRLEELESVETLAPAPSENIAMLAIYMGDVTKEVADKRMKMVRKHLSQKLGDVQRC
ncbi:uncharacterized protein LOC142568110 [Dermacentor variabilis]|uniref:uncharacterized protein LOC142568110 n=1 Tax=Dermacentor variabilis TaxID=34621 RepID=UPI003F5C3A21